MLAYSRLRSFKDSKSGFYNNFDGGGVVAIVGLCVSLKIGKLSPFVLLFFLLVFKIRIDELMVLLATHRQLEIVELMRVMKRRENLQEDRRILNRRILKEARKKVKKGIKKLKRNCDDEFERVNECVEEEFAALTKHVADGLSNVNKRLDAIVDRRRGWGW